VDDRNAISGSGSDGRRWRPWAFRIAAVFLGVLPFILAEAGLRILDMGQPEDSADALTGFNQRLPLFVRQDDMYRTALAREPFFLSQEFPAAKPRKGVRVFCFGGSTVYGHPYAGETAFPRWLEMELRAGAPGQSCQVLNCGGVSYASYRLAPLVREVLHYQPDLIIVATGHNEFLEDRSYQALKSRASAWASLQNAAYSLRLFNLARGWLKPSAKHPTQLSTEVEPKLDQASGYASYHRDDVWHEQVVAQFDESVRTMVADCRAAGVPIILVKLGANLRDCPPFKSEHRAGLTADQERAWQDAFEAGGAAKAADLRHALELYLKAEAIDGEYALLAYRIARVLDRLGRKAEALTYYLKAREQDVCPLRIIRPLEEALSRIAADTGTPLVDAAALLAAQAPDAIPGFDCYLDHVHPNIGGHQRIARALAAEARRCHLTPNAITWPEEARQHAYADHLKQLGPRYLAEGRRRVFWLDTWARRQRLLDESLPRDAQGYVRVGFRCLDLGDEESAWPALDQALLQDPGILGLIRARAQELQSQGCAESGTSLLQRFAAPANRGR
jgi:tetratricopeptide (TPR) repeat protein